jgi:hypothetical protein
MHPGRFVGLLGLGGAALLLAPTANAQSEAAPHAAAKTDSLDDNARYAWLDSELGKVEGPTERWYTGWTATFAWVSVGQYSFAGPSPNAGLREFSLVGAVNSTLGLLAMLAAPNTLGGNARERLQKFDASSPLGAFERRRRAEYLLHATAAEESFYHSPIPLILATLSSAAGGAILIYGYHQIPAGWGTFGAGVGITILQMLTRPSSAGDAWDRYVNNTHPSPNVQVPPDQIHLTFDVTPMGAAMNGTF